MPRASVPGSNRRRLWGSCAISELDAGFGQAGDVEVDDEKAAGEFFFRRLFIRQALGGTRDEELFEILAAKGGAGDLAHGQFDGPVDRAVRRIADDAGAAPAGVPEIAFAVDDGAVGKAAVF